MNGTWQTTGGGSGTAVRFVAVVAAAAAAVSYLATILLIIAIALGVVLVLVLAGALWLRRRYGNPDGAAMLARQGAALRAYAGQQGLEARPVTVIHYHGGHAPACRAGRGRRRGPPAASGGSVSALREGRPVTGRRPAGRGPR
jgi:hypothetical protein